MERGNKLQHCIQIISDEFNYLGIYLGSLFQVVPILPEYFSILTNNDDLPLSPLKEKKERAAKMTTRKA